MDRTENDESRKNYNEASQDMQWQTRPLARARRPSECLFDHKVVANYPPSFLAALLTSCIRKKLRRKINSSLNRYTTQNNQNLNLNEGNGNNA